MWQSVFYPNPLQKAAQSSNIGNGPEENEIIEGKSHHEKTLCKTNAGMLCYRKKSLNKFTLK